MRTIPLSACPVRTSEDSQGVDAGDGHELRECRSCGTVFAPEYADPAEVFTEGYLDRGAGRFGIDLSHPRFHAYLLRCGHRRMEITERATGVRGGTLCDVGCGTGELLQAAIARGWTVRGVDLEHMPSAPSFLAALARWARPGGFVAVESPNWASVQRDVYHSRWSALRPLEHLIHLTPDSLRKAFVNSGLEPVAIRTPSHLDPVHTVDEALEALGRPHWKQRFQRLSGSGQEPSRLGTAFLKVLENRDAGRSKGAALIGVARRPA